MNLHTSSTNSDTGTQAAFVILLLEVRGQGHRNKLFTVIKHGSMHPSDI